MLTGSADRAGTATGLKSVPVKISRKTGVRGDATNRSDGPRNASPNRRPLGGRSRARRSGDKHGGADETSECVTEPQFLLLRPLGPPANATPFGFVPVQARSRRHLVGVLPAIVPVTTGSRGQKFFAGRRLTAPSPCRAA